MKPLPARRRVQPGSFGETVRRRGIPYCACPRPGRFTTSTAPPGRCAIEPVRARHLDDLDALFATGDPRWCQCAFMRSTNADWNSSTPRTNREIHHRAVRRAARAGRAAGLIAYDEDGAVGWVSFGPRTDFDRLERLAAAGTGGRRAGLVGGLLRGGRSSPAPWRRRGSARGDDRLGGRSRGGDPRGLPGRHVRRPTARRRSVARDAQPVRGRRFRGRGDARQNKTSPSAADRAAAAI